jgi:hypothetical protein
MKHNIDGSKQVVHKVEHRVNWGYVAAGIGALVVAWVVYRGFVESDPKNEDDGI